MKTVLALCLLAAGVAPAFAQTSRLEGGSTTLGSIVFYYETRLEPPVPSLGESLNLLIYPSNGANVFYNGPAPDTVHRLMLDPARKVYFGYDARISVVGGRGPLGQEDERLYQVAFGPLTLTPEIERMLGSAAAWKQVPAPKFPAPRTIRPYEVLEVPMLTNDAWGQRLTEYVTVGDAPRQGFNPGRRREFAFGTGSPRDFTAADVVLAVVEPRVSWSYRTTSGGKPGGGVRNVQTSAEASGAVVWVYVPNGGRFLLSLIPRRQFARAGTLRGTSLSFNVDGMTYSLSSATRIAPGEGAYNVYVLHQPAWKPTYEHADVNAVLIGAADRAEYLLGQ